MFLLECFFEGIAQMEVYIDASGDPGLNERDIKKGVSTPYYCIGVVAFNKVNPDSILEKATKEYQTFGKHLPGEIKYLRLKQDARHLLVKHLLKEDVQRYVLGLMLMFSQVHFIITNRQTKIRANHLYS